jgi:hypothetical protein
MLTGAALGAAAVQGLHAQAKPPIYVIGEIDYLNQEAYLRDYAPAHATRFFRRWLIDDARPFS